MCIIFVSGKPQVFNITSDNGEMNNFRAEKLNHTLICKVFSFPLPKTIKWTIRKCESSTSCSKEEIELVCIINYYLKQAHHSFKLRGLVPDFKITWAV
jgi:hypothetical protein